MTGRSEALIPPETLKSLYTTMLRIRLVEERIADVLSAGGEIICPVHLYIGQEAVAAGVCANLVAEDYVFSTHRSHGHYIAKGGDIRTLMAELYGRETGCSRGRGGSMHLAAPEVGFPGSSAIVAGTIPLAAGAALSFVTRGTDNVAVAFFGDGATNEGVFYESLNFASLRKLPVIFVCENNLYSTHMPIASCLADASIYRKAEAFCMSGVRIDGNDVTGVFQAAKTAVEDARSGKGPALIECLTYRHRGHVGPNYDIDKGLRSQAELDEWKAKDPVKKFEESLQAGGVLSERQQARIRAEIDVEVEEALDFARRSPLPTPDKLLDNVFKT